MTPDEFLTGIREDEEISFKEAVTRAGKPILITDGVKKFEVLSYYYSPERGCMCLDIQQK